MNLHEIFLASEIAGKNNGNGGSVDLSDYYTKSQTDGLLVNKIDKVNGMGLSENSFTDDEKTKLSVLENYNDTEIRSEILTNRTTIGYQCKNLLRNTAVSRTTNGVTFTVSDDGSVTADGTATAAFTFTLYQWENLPNFLKNTAIILSGCAAGGRPDGYRIAVHSKQSSALSWTGIGADTGSGMTFSFDDTMNIVRVVIAGNSGTVFDNVTFYPMIRYAEIADDTYEPYRPSVEEYITDLEARITALEESRT